MELLDNWGKILCSALALLIAIIGHEIMHGLVAKYYGDETASSAGRLSFNPLKHIDPIGSILLPILLFALNAPFLFGWAKPVPINIQQIINRHGYLAACNVSLAGVVYNFSIAILSALLLRSIHLDMTVTVAFLVYFLLQVCVYNLVLGIFNLYPIPPLDGSRAMAFLCLKLGFYNVARNIFAFERYGVFVLLLILATPLSGIFTYPIDFLLKSFMS